MAHGLTESSAAKVHQALHGYADGHRQIALSAALKPRDKKTLLALSDISGIGAQIDENGYLTGYPLTESGYYALARTWPAPEMPRPGCVWTQTLLIDFNDLAALRSADQLLKFFTRPSAAQDFHAYTKAKRLHVNGVREGGLSGWSLSWASSILSALYGKSKKRVVASRGSLQDVDEAVLSIWLQQWPRLRRSFRFCTLAASDRSIEGAEFDLQIVSGVDRSVRSRFLNAVDPDSISFPNEIWLEDATNDLEMPDFDGLRSFFRKLGSDISSGREAFRPLCLLHRNLAKISGGSGRVNEAVKILNAELGAKQAGMARATVAGAALASVSSLDRSAFEFLWANLGLVDPVVLRGAASEVGRAILHHDPLKLMEISNNDSAKEIIFDGMLSDLSADELTACFTVTPDLTFEVAKRRPEIVGDPRFWASVRELDSILEIARESGLQSAAVAAMIRCERGDLTKAAVRAFGEATTLDALNQLNLAESDRLGLWVQECAKDASAVGSFLAGQSNVQQVVLYALALTLSPDGVPNEHGPDPWLLGWRRSTGTIGEAERTYVLAFLLSRALGRESRSQAELAEVSFRLVHKAVANDHLPEDGWRVLESRLPKSLFWPTWDHCRRIRAGVVDLFVDRDLNPRYFARLAKSEELFIVLAETAALTFRGREYLKRTLADIAGAEDPLLSNRGRALEQILDRWR